MNDKLLRRFSRTVLATAAALLFAPAAHAEDFIPGGQEIFTLNVGGILNQFDTSVMLNGSTTRGTPIDLEGNGLRNSLVSLEVQATWRMTERNRVGATYFTADRSGSRSYTQDIQIGDRTIAAGVDVGAQAKDRFLLFDYRYSFYKTSELEVAGALGFYGGKFDFSFNASGSGGGRSASDSSSSSTTVPLPVIGATVDWYIEPRWKVAGALQGMKAKIGDVDGSLVVVGLGTDYMLLRNFGVGVSYMFSRLSADVTQSGFNGNVDWQTNAVLLYGTVKF